MDNVEIRDDLIIEEEEVKLKLLEPIIRERAVKDMKDVYYVDSIEVDGNDITIIDNDEDATYTFGDGVQFMDLDKATELMLYENVSPLVDEDDRLCWGFIVHNEDDRDVVYLFHNNDVIEYK